MPTPFNLIWSKNGAPVPGLRQSDIKYTATLTSGGGNTQLTVPSSGNMGSLRSASTNKWVVNIITEPGTAVFFAVNNTAEVPAGATFALSTSELIPPRYNFFKEVDAGDVLNFITADATAGIVTGKQQRIRLCQAP